MKEIDYKDTAMLGRFISDRGKIEPRRRTGTCNRHQHTLANAIKQARHIALLPFVPEHIHRQGQVPPLNLALPMAPKAEAEKPVEVSAEAVVEVSTEVPAEMSVEASGGDSVQT